VLPLPLTGEFRRTASEHRMANWQRRSEVQHAQSPRPPSMHCGPTPNATRPLPIREGKTKAWNDRLMGQGDFHLPQRAWRACDSWARGRWWSNGKGSSCGRDGRIGEWSGRWSWQAGVLASSPFLARWETNGFRNGGGRGRLWFSFLERGKEESTEEQEKDPQNYAELSRLGLYLIIILYVYGPYNVARLSQSNKTHLNLLIIFSNNPTSLLLITKCYNISKILLQYFRNKVASQHFS
jgi:hypothetical protein